MPTFLTSDWELPPHTWAWFLFTLVIPPSPQQSICTCFLSTVGTKEVSSV